MNTATNIWNSGITTLSRIMALLFLTLASSTSHALEGGFNMRWGYDFGYQSTKLVSASTLGNPNDHRSIMAGEGEFFSMGFSLADDSRTFILDTSLGLKSSTLCDTYSGGYDTWMWPTCAWNAELNVELLRIPAELLLIYQHPSGMRFGAGLAYHINPNLRVDAPLTRYTIKFDNTPGYVIELAIPLSHRPRAGSSGYLGVRGTWMNYTMDGVEVAQARSVGLFLGLSTH